MATFTQIEKELADNSFMRECVGKLETAIEKGEYPMQELTEDKIIELLTSIILELEENSARRHFTTNINIEQVDFDYYFKILWFVLVNNIGTNNFFSNSEQQTLKSKLVESVKQSLNQ